MCRRSQIKRSGLSNEEANTVQKEAEFLHTTQQGTGLFYIVKQGGRIIRHS